MIATELMALDGKLRFIAAFSQAKSREEVVAGSRTPDSTEFGLPVLRSEVPSLSDWCGWLS